MSIAAILVAGGSGTRLGAATPKQYLSVAGEPVVRHAARALLRHVATVQPVGDATAIGAALDGLHCLPAVPGGAERQDSVRAGLEALGRQPEPPEIVLVHDAARPFFPEATIPALLAALQTTDGAIPGLPVADTLKRTADGLIAVTIPRENLYRAQTPQAFRFARLLALHRRAGPGATDDASLLEIAGLPVAVVAGSEDNIKITYPEDLARMERILARPMQPRIGTGFDVHAFARRPPAHHLRDHRPARKGPCRPLRCRRRHSRALRRHLRGARRGRHRTPLPAIRGDLERRRQRALPGPRSRPHRGARRSHLQYRHHARVRAPERSRRTRPR